MTKIGVQDVLKRPRLSRRKSLINLVSIVNFIEYNAQSILAKYTDYTPVSGLH